MTRALLVKELRETVGIALAAVALHLCIVFGMMGITILPVGPGSSGGIPFIGDGYLVTYGLITGGFAIVLGFRQSLGEAVGGTYLFLFHRPYDRWKLIATKLLAGAVVLLAGSSVPILLYGWWASSPGTRASPFEWAMTDGVWKLCLSMTVVYLGSYLSGIRPGRWKATRLLPLAAAGLVTVALQVVPWWLFLGLGLVVLVDVLLIVEILYVSRSRDF